MGSLVAPIEVSPVRDVRTDDDTLTVALEDGRVITTPLDWYPRLAHGTPDERARWEPIGDGHGIHWPALDEDIGVEGLIAGRKSGESGESFKRWLAIQEQLRKESPHFRELRRELLRVGRLSADEIPRRLLEAVDAWESVPCDWRIGLSPAALDRLQELGVPETQERIEVYQAENESAALTALQRCIAAGFGQAPAESSIGPSGIQVFAYQERAKRLE